MFGLLFALTLGCIKPFPDAPKEIEETGYSSSPDLPCATPGFTHNVATDALFLTVCLPYS